MAWAVLLVALLVVAYTFAGYPLAIAAWARLRPRPVRREPIWPNVTMVVVAYNEAARIVGKLQTCLEQDYPAERLSILVVSDGSIDDTPAIVERLRHPRVRVIANPQRRGKPSCLNDAVAATDTEVVVFTDARQALSPQAVRCLVENLADAQVGAVSGELVFRTDDASGYAHGIDSYWRYEKFLRRREALVHSAPGVTGALYAMRRDLYRPIAPDTVLDDVLIPMQVVRQGRRVVFDERALAYDRPSQRPADERVRKVRTLAGNYQIVVREPWLLLPWRNPIALQYTSHKVLRLVAPFALVAMLLASAWLAPRSSAAAVLLAAQLVAYGLPLIGRGLPAVAGWRVTRLSEAFLTLNAYAALGLAQFARGGNLAIWSSTRAESRPGAPGST